jgi:protein O-GlcNAc transferase
MTGRAGTARLVAAVLAALAIGAGSPPARADVEGALADYKAGHYLEAVAELQAIVDRTPGYAYGYFLLGHCMLKMKRPAEAEGEFRRAVSLDPTRAEYYQGLALALKSRADWAHTVQTASQGLDRVADPRQRYALLALRGYAFGALERWREAARDLEAARAIHSEPWVCVLLGKAYVAQGSFSGAIPPLREALTSAPDDTATLRLLAESLVHVAADETDPERKRAAYTEALGYARRIAAAHPDDSDVVHLVGRAALGAGQLEQAESLFLHVLSLDPRQCYAMVNLGRTYMAMSRWSEAESFLKQASSCAPRLAAVYETLGDLYLERGMTQLAADAFRRADEIEPNSSPGARPARGQSTPETTPVRAP